MKLPSSRDGGLDEVLLHMDDRLLVLSDVLLHVEALWFADSDVLLDIEVLWLAAATHPNSSLAGSKLLFTISVGVIAALS